MAVGGVIAAAELAGRLADLEPIGMGSDGTTRLAWTPELAAAEHWFVGQAAAGDLALERDPAGNLWACPDAPPPWWAVGSHLDTVRSGGRYDGALGVVAGFAVAAAIEAPVAVIAFADEEGARFGTPTFGSRALVGRPHEALDRRDDDGVPLRDALSDFGVDPDRIAEAPAWLERLHGFLELHIDQSLDVAGAGSAAAAVTGLAARLRLRAELRGRADHAGTTRREHRRDALAAAARLIVAADELAEPEMICTAGRIEVEPNTPTTVPARARVWLDARAPAPALLDRWESRVAATLPDGALELLSRSPAIAFDARVRAALAPDGTPAVTCFAGHDAGIVAERRPAGMVLVRNPTGVSHAPEEDVDLADAAAGADLIARALEDLTS